MKERVFYFDFIKTIAIIGVIVLHASAPGVAYEALFSYNWHVSNIFDSLVRCSVPLFCMVTGSLFLDTSREINLSKNFKRILLALIFWRLIYAILISWVNYPALSNEWMKESAQYFFLHSGHDWYLFMLLGFYLVAPILRQIARSEKVEKLFIFLWIIFSSLPMIELIPKLGKVVLFINASMSVSIVCGFSGYFLLGHYLSKKCQASLTNKVTSLLIGIFFLGGVFLICVGTFLLSRIEGSLNMLLYNYTGLLVILVSSCVFLLAKNHMAFLRKVNYMSSFISDVSRHSLGIYLIHILFLVALDKIGFNYGTLNPIIGIPFLSLIILMASYLSVKIMNLLPFLRRFL